jgi:hypothetical protein
MTSQQFSIADRPWLIPCGCDDLIRIGTDSDGGYITSRQAVDASQHLLVLGIGDDWSFERDWHKINHHSDIDCWDGTVEIPKNSDFYALGLRHNCVNVLGYNSAGSENLQNIFDNIATNDIFVKIDIEGHEEAMIDFQDKMQILQQHFSLIHVHANNAGPICNDFPEVLELSFVRRGIKQVLPRTDLYLDIDYPNTSMAPEYVLVVS